MMAFYRTHPRAARWTAHLCRGVPAAIALVYLLLLAVLLFRRSDRLAPVLIVPAVTLGAVCLLRRLVFRSRPYVRYDFEPLLPHDDSSSFPSRHSASAAAIALAGAFCSPVLGWVLGFAALVTGATRVLTGLHFPGDAAAGFLLALVIGLPGYSFFA